MSDSHEQPHRAWPIAVILAWLIPGLGHWYLGRRGKAAVFFVGVVGLFTVGWGLGQWKVVDLDNQWLFTGQVFSGVLPLVAEWMRGSGALADEVLVSIRYEMAVLYTLVAGLLNLLVILDAYMVANGIRRPTQETQDGEGTS